MKKLFPLLFVITCATAAFSQVCVRDSSLIQTGALLSPALWDTATMQYNLNDACILHPYNQSVTINVPTTYGDFQLISLTIATTGAINNLPIGLTYSCDPPNCVFIAGSLGCIQLFGTPTAANIAPDTFDISIETNLNAVGIPFQIPVELPNQLPGDNHYYLVLKDAQCLVGTFDQNTSIGYVKNAPNPFTNETTITVESLVSGDFQFEVFDILGRRVHARVIRLDAGINEFTFDGSQLLNGSYFYTIGNRDGNVSRRLVIGR